MADTTVRVAEEQKDEINEIAKKIGDGASQKEAISYLLQLEKVKGNKIMVVQFRG